MDKTAITSSVLCMALLCYHAIKMIALNINKSYILIDMTQLQ